MPAKAILSEVRYSTIFERAVPIDSMFVDVREKGGYARPINPRRLDKLIAEYDPEAIGLVLLSMRDTNPVRYAIIDGHHRAEATLAKGITTLDALVYIDLTREDEARLYRRFGDYLKQTARDRWAAAVIEHHPETLALQKIVESHGLYIIVTGGQSTHGIQAVEGVMGVARDHGPQILSDTLAFLVESFPNDEKAFTATMLRGTAAFLVRYQNHPKFLRNRLVGRLQAKGGRAALTSRGHYIQSMERVGPQHALGMAYLYFHNRGNQTNLLPEWQAVHIDSAEQQRRRERIQAKAVPARRAQAAALRNGKPSRTEARKTKATAKQGR